jgi:aminomethyltransferase
MNDGIRKSTLSDFISRHSEFDFDTFIASNPGEDEFDRWNDYCLPKAYSDVLNEYNALRNSCALFDATPMMKYRFKGKDGGAFLDRILTAPVSQLKNMRAAYGLLCNEEGYLLDDGIILKLTDEDYIIITTEIDLIPHFTAYNNFNDLVITDATELLSGLALQGPESCKVLSELGFKGVEQLAPFELKHFELDGNKYLVGRLGFTGYLGYEVWFNNDGAAAFISAFEDAEKILNIKVLGYGLDAINICRIEAGMIVPGWDTAGEFSDLNYERTPFELTLGWNVKLGHTDEFAGKFALKYLKETGPCFRMTGFTIEDDCELEFCQVLYATVDGTSVQVGTLPSVARQPVRKVWIGFASIKAQYKDTPDLYVMDKDRKVPCQPSKLPFINLARRNQLPAEI